MVERVGKIKIVTKDGKINDKLFLDLTKNSPLGSEVQTGFVEQGLWAVAFHPKFKENGYFFVSYSSLPFNGAHVIARYTVDPASPDVVTVDQANKTVKVIMNIPQPYYNHYGGGIRFGPDGYPLHRQGRRRLGRRSARTPARTKSELWGKMLRVDVDTPDDVRLQDSGGQPLRQGLPGPHDDALRHHRGGLLQDPHGRSPGDLGVRPAQSLLVRASTRRPAACSSPTSARTICEEIDWAAGKGSKGGENYGWKLNMGTRCHPMIGT